MTENRTSLNRTEFETLIKDVVSNLYDYAVLENLPKLAEAFPVEASTSHLRSLAVREIVQNAIDQLRPPGKPNSASPEWRPYLILHQRYIEGIQLQELAAQFSISSRQLRRDHHRGLQALSAVLWERFGPKTEQTSAPSHHEIPFEIHRENIELAATVNSIVMMLHPHLAEEGIRLDLSMDEPPYAVFTDRVILRQMLISMINHAAQLLLDDLIVLQMQHTPGGVELRLKFQVVPDYYSVLEGDQNESLEQIRYWCDQIEADFTELSGSQFLEFILLLPASEKKVILVVDDQEPAINMFRRFLSRSNFTVIGITQPGDVIANAQKYHPALITLDVMMPLLDGWEVLQALKLDEHTAKIPVLICSAWEEPELSRSLGAVGFLKKPVTQKEFLGFLESIGLLI